MLALVLALAGVGCLAVSAAVVGGAALLWPTGKPATPPLVASAPPPPSAPPVAPPVRVPAAPAAVAQPSAPPAKPPASVPVSRTSEPPTVAKAQPPAPTVAPVVPAPTIPKPVVPAPAPAEPPPVRAAEPPTVEPPAKVPNAVEPVAPAVAEPTPPPAPAKPPVAETKPPVVETKPPVADAKEPPRDFNLPQVQKSVVFIKTVVTGITLGTGSGFLVDRNGLIFTNRHVIRAPELFPGKTTFLVGVPAPRDPEQLEYFRASLVFTPDADDPLDFAVLKIQAKPGYGDFPALPLAADRPKLAQPVAVIGFPFANAEAPSLSFNKGNISRVQEKHDGKAFMVTDAAVNPGNSGGPLVNQAGEVLGIVTAKRVDATSVGYGLYLSEVEEAARLARQRFAAVQASAGPLAPDELPASLTLPLKADAWAVGKGQFHELTKRKGGAIDGAGQQYWMTSKEALPENFHLVMSCWVDPIKGVNQTIGPKEEKQIGSLVIRLDDAATPADILDGRGTSIVWSKSVCELHKDGPVLASVQRGNPDGPFLLSVVKQGSDVIVSAEGSVVLRHRDPRLATPGRRKLTLGGFLSKLLIVGQVSVASLDGMPPVLELPKATVAGINVVQTKVTPAGAEVTVEVTLSDPDKLVRSAQVRYARLDPFVEPVQPDANGRWPEIANGQVVDLKVDGAKATATFTIAPSPNDAPRRGFLFQASITLADGTRYVVAPVTRGVVLRGSLAPPPAAAPPPAQQPPAPGPKPPAPVPAPKPAK